MSLLNKSASGFLWQMLSITIQALTSIGFMAVISRLLSKEAFGNFALASVVVGYFAMLSEFGFSSAIVQKKEVKDEDVRFAWTMNILVALLLFLLLVVFSNQICGFFDFKFSRLFLIALSIQLLFNAIASTSRSLLIREMNFKKLFFAQAVPHFIGYVVIGLFMGYNGQEEWSLLTAVVTTSFLIMILTVLFKPLKMSFKGFNFSESTFVFKYGFSLTKLRLVNQTANHGDKLIIGKLFTASELGVYERFMKVIVLPELYIGRVSDSVLFSLFSRTQTDLVKLNTVFFSTLRIVSIVVFVISFYFFNYSEIFIHVILGENWLSYGELFRAMAFLLFVQVYARFSDILVRAKSEMKRSFKIKLIYLLLHLTVLYLLYPYGIKVMVYGSLVVKSINGIMMLILCSKIVKMRSVETFLELSNVIVVAVSFSIIHWILGYANLSDIMQLAISLIFNFSTLMLLIIKTNWIVRANDKYLLFSVYKDLSDKK